MSMEGLPPKPPPREPLHLKPVEADNDIEAALLVIMLERANILTTQLTNQIQQMKNRNEILRILNDIMTRLNNGGDGNKAVNWKDEKSVVLPDGNKMTIKEFLTTYGGIDAGKLPATGDGKWGQKDCQLVAGYVKGSMDSMNSDAQQDQLRLQSLNSKRDQAYDTATNFVSSSNKAKSNIIGNLR